MPIPWTLIISLAQSVGPDIVAEVKRLYANWKVNNTPPTPAEWAALEAKVSQTSLQKILDAEIARQATA